MRCSRDAGRGEPLNETGNRTSHAARDDVSERKLNSQRMARPGVDANINADASANAPNVLLFMTAPYVVPSNYFKHVFYNKPRNQSPHFWTKPCQQAAPENRSELADQGRFMRTRPSATGGPTFLY